MTDTKTGKRYEGEHPRKFDIGDIVQVFGYGGRIWKVDGYIHSHHVYDDEEWTELCYELTGVDTDDWIDAFEEDMRLLARASEAEEYLRRYRAIMGRRNERKRSRLSKKEHIDILLDQYNVFKSIYERTNNESIKEWMDDVTEKIRKLSGDVY